MFLKKSLNYLPTQMASEVKTRQTSNFKYVICQDPLLSVWAVNLRLSPAPGVKLLVGRSDPKFLLSPLKHTPPASPFSHCFPPLPLLSPFQLSFLVCYSASRSALLHSFSKKQWHFSLVVLCVCV